MNTHSWEPAATTLIAMGNPSQLGSFPVHVASNFKRPSRIVKPSSRSNSPRNGRRRMTTAGHFPARTRSVIDHARASAPQFVQPVVSTARPISWHPQSMEKMNFTSTCPPAINQTWMATPNTIATAERSGLATPMFYSICDEPQIQELITPLEELSADDSLSQWQKSQDFSMEAWLLQQQTKQSRAEYVHAKLPIHDDSTYYEADQYMTSHYGMMVSVSPDQQPSSAFSISPVEISDTDFDDDDEDETKENDKEELVGMGLYDSPAQVQSSSHLFGGFGDGKRKSLKLEDAFEPTRDVENDEDGDCEDEDDTEFIVARTTTIEKNSQLCVAGVTPLEVSHLADAQHGMSASVQFPYSINNGHMQQVLFTQQQQQQYQQWQMQSQQSYGWI